MRLLRNFLLQPRLQEGRLGVAQAGVPDDGGRGRGQRSTITKRDIFVAWFAEKLDSAMDALCLAWKFRKARPTIGIAGDADGRVGEMRVIADDVWERLPEEHAAVFRSGCESPDFDEEQHYFPSPTVTHAAAKLWPGCAPRMIFPAEPKVMDLLAATNPVLASGKYGLWQPHVVRIRGLEKGKAYNGKMGVVGGRSENQSRWAVKFFQNEKVLSVKAASIDLLDFCITEALGGLC